MVKFWSNRKQNRSNVELIKYKPNTHSVSAHFTNSSNSTITTNGSDDATSERKWGLLALFVFVVFGFAGNLLVCLAIKFHVKLQNSTNNYLFTLAITDMLMCVIVMPLAIAKLFFSKILYFLSRNKINTI